ncbi:MAG: DUF2332 domain-containing protein [Candidatus Binataceae bacterium]
MNEHDLARLSSRYLRFADGEARGRSPLYEAITRGVAADKETLGFLVGLPPEKRQPNLLLGAVRHLFGTPADWAGFQRTLLANREAVGRLMRERSTQTNEPARCATLLPVLARLAQPLALIEVGASAGLCLLPDRYGYDYERGVSLGSANGAPVFSCSVNPETPLPRELPNIVWRAGLDLNPIEVGDPAQTAWLETLVWPEQTERLANLRAAIEIARAVKPRLLRGDLRSDALAHLCGEAPRNATRVLFHTAVVSYVTDRAEREAFMERAASLCDVWISNEVSGVFPAIASRAGANTTPGRFLLAVNGAPVAWCDPHGAALEWIAGAS